MHDQSKQDRRFREMLERRSIGEPRADRAGLLNRLAAGDALGQPGVAAYLLLQAAQRTHGREIRRLNKAHDRALAAGAFDRLARRVPASETTDIPASERDDARNDRFVTPVTPGGGTYFAAGQGGSRFDGNARDRRDYQPESGEPVAMSIEQMRVVAGVKALMSRYF